MPKDSTLQSADAFARTDAIDMRLAQISRRIDALCGEDLMSEFDRVIGLIDDDFAWNHSAEIFDTDVAWAGFAKELRDAKRSDASAELRRRASLIEHRRAEYIRQLGISRYDWEVVLAHQKHIWLCEYELPLSKLHEIRADIEASRSLPEVLSHAMLAVIAAVETAGLFHVSQ